MIRTQVRNSRLGKVYSFPRPARKPLSDCLLWVSSGECAQKEARMHLHMPPCRNMMAERLGMHYTKGIGESPKEAAGHS